MSFLDDAGVTKLTSYLKSKIQTLLSKKQDTLISGTNIKSINGNSMLGSGNIAIKGSSWYGTSSTAATTATKSVTCGGYVLQTGGGTLVCVTFSTANTYVSGALKLNVNSTGAKTIYVNNAATSASNTLLWDAGETLTFVYSGQYYYFVGRSKTSGGSMGSVTQVQTSGTEIAQISVDGTSTSIYAPSGGSASWVDISSSFEADYGAGADIYAITNGRFVYLSVDDSSGEMNYVNVLNQNYYPARTSLGVGIDADNVSLPLVADPTGVIMGYSSSGTALITGTVIYPITPAQ